MTVKTQLDRQKIIPLWMDAFGDDEEYINTFLDVAQREGKYFGAYDEKGELLSMLFLLDLPIKLERESTKCAYMYACATRKDCRGKGFFRQLYENAKQALEKEEYDCVFCVPASDKLFDFYKKIGFEKQLYRRRISAKNDGKPCNLSFETKTHEQAYEIYKNSISENLYCPIKSREVFELSLMAAEADFYSFKDGYLIYDGEKINELVCCKSEENILLQAARFFGKDLCAYTLPKENEREKYAALCVLSEKNISDNTYANLLMD